MQLLPVGNGLFSTLNVSSDVKKFKISRHGRALTEVRQERREADMTGARVIPHVQKCSDIVTITYFTYCVKVLRNVLYTGYSDTLDSVAISLPPELLPLLHPQPRPLVLGSVILQQLVLVAAAVSSP